MLGGMGMSELLIILLIVVVIFGANRLPEIGASLGKSIKSFKKAVTEEEKPLQDSKETPKDEK